MQLWVFAICEGCLQKRARRWQSCATIVGAMVKCLFTCTDISVASVAATTHVGYNGVVVWVTMTLLCAH
jgi:hypothetical protein